MRFNAKVPKDEAAPSLWGDETLDDINDADDIVAVQVRMAKCQRKREKERKRYVEMQIVSLYALIRHMMETDYILIDVDKEAQPREWPRSSVCIDQCRAAATIQRSCVLRALLG